MRWFVCICISLLIASTASARDKNRWRGLFVGQGRAEAHEVIYGLSEYHSPWGESAFFCAMMIAKLGSLMTVMLGR